MAKKAIDRFIEGLDCIRSNVTECSFYNSSGGDASFHCKGLTSAQQGILRSLGWVDVSDEYACFRSWSDE